MKILRATAPALVISAQFISVNINADTLEAVVSRMLETNPQAQVFLNRYQASGESVNAARAGYLPTVDYKGGIGTQKLDTPVTPARQDQDKHFKPRENALVLNQNIFNGYSTTNEYKKSKQQQESRKELLRSKAESLALDVTDVYLKVLEHEKQVQLAQHNLNTHERIFELIEKRSKQGVANQSDFYQADGRLARARANLIAANNNLQDAKTEYFRLVNETPNNLTMPQLNDLELPTELDSALATAMKEHPALSASLFELQASQYGYDRTRSGFFPSIDLTLTRRWNQDIHGIDGKHDDTSAMINVSFNLFRGGYDSARRQEAAYQLEESRAHQQDAQRMVTESMKLAWSALTNLTAEEPFLKRHMDASAMTVKAYQKQFDLGKRSLLDLLDSENESYQSQRHFTSNHYRVSFARYRVLNNMGQLLRKLQVSLPAHWRVSES